MKNSAIIPLLSLPAVAVAAAPAADAPQRPNILAIVCEDISCYLGCYGDPVCVSPNLDRFAQEEAIRHTRMFTCVGVSAPSRYSLITARYSSNDGANYMRVNEFDKDHEAVPPAGVKCFTEYLRAAGYYCTNNAKTDYQFKAPLSAWDESSNKAHWKNGPEGAPFYAVFNLNVTHESQIWAHTNDPLSVDPAQVPLPPYYPDNAVVRHDIAVMYSNITRMDKEFQALCDEVKQAGKWENTIVIWYSDNGGPTPRGKREIMDSGSNVPFMIRFPDRRGAGTVSNDLNMFIDIPATIMALAGVEQPKNIHGKPMYGVKSVEKRKYVFGATDRFDEQVEKRASIRDGRYLYIRNYMPQQSLYRSNAYRLRMAMMKNMEQLYKEGKLDAVQSLWFNTPAEAESLYDCDTDPHNVVNLATQSGYASLLKKMRAAYEKEWIAAYNSKWVKYREEDFVKEAHPEGVKPRAPKPAAEIKNGKLTIVNPSSELSYCYQVNGSGLKGNKAHWFLYSKPVEVKEGDQLTLVAIRAGWKNSDKTVVTYE